VGYVGPFAPAALHALPGFFLESASVFVLLSWFLRLRSVERFREIDFLFLKNRGLQCVVATRDFVLEGGLG
jgi:hypothetical protein